MLINFLKVKKFHVSFILFFVLFLGVSEKSEAAKKYRVSANSAIFSNSTKVKRLYGKSVHKKVLPASTVKVMTALLVLEKLPLSRMVKISKNATYPEPSKIYAKPGDRYKASDLLFAILLSSANDGSVALAEAVAGTEKDFVVMMNKRAKQLGCRHTKFANSNGLPTKSGTQYTTAYDMYLIFRAALKHSFFRKAITYKHKTIYSENGRKTILKSHNKILFFDWKQKLFGKTGYTRKAKSCFVGYTKQGNDDLIIAIFGCKSGRRWNDIKHIVSYYGGISL
ncbi:MAG: serine hydrolase [Candidatus Omnitrophica bacterium]|nr:serine hydrolase [Candidatus Omnitrophota bacterium]